MEEFDNTNNQDAPKWEKVSIDLFANINEKDQNYIFNSYGEELLNIHLADIKDGSKSEYKKYLIEIINNLTNLIELRMNETQINPDLNTGKTIHMERAFVKASELIEETTFYVDKFLNWECKSN